MTFRMYLLIMALATVLSWIAWTGVLISTNPYEAGLPGFLIFYLTLFMGLAGTLTLLGVVYRVKILRRHEVKIREVRRSFRHAIALSSAAIISLALSAQGGFRWWYLPLIILVLAATEYFFLIKEESRRV